MMFHGYLDIRSIFLKTWVFTENVWENFSCSAVCCDIGASFALIPLYYAPVTAVPLDVISASHLTAPLNLVRNGTADRDRKFYFIARRRIGDRMSSSTWQSVGAAFGFSVDGSFGRFLDIVISLLLFLFVFPLFLLVWLAVRSSSKGEAFIRQDRVGARGATFGLIKFRTTAAAGPDGIDRQVTPVGHFLRLTRIDEIPQLINVLCGDMSVVGPRPEHPAFGRGMARAAPHDGKRAGVKPGIIDWAPVDHSKLGEARTRLCRDRHDLSQNRLIGRLRLLVSAARATLLRRR